MLRRFVTLTRTRDALRPSRTNRSISSSSYIAALRRRYPSADPASLVVSFLVLHELTAILPLSVLFGTFHYLGLGAGIVGWTLAEPESTSQATDGTTSPLPQAGFTTEGIKVKVRQWIREGEEKAERLGKRYGWFGWDQESKRETPESPARNPTSKPLMTDESLKVSGDVANVAAAYLIVKALLPLRILVSLRLSPTLANVVAKRFKGLQARGAKWMKRNQTVNP